MNTNSYHIEKKIKKKRRTSIILMMLLTCSIAFIFIFKTDFFLIKKIEVKGNEILSEEKIIYHSGIIMGNNIFKERIGNIKENLKKQSYIHSVSAKRSLPNKMIIEIQERKETAVIPFMENYLIVDEEGRVLQSVPSSSNGLKIIRGLEFSNFMEGEILQPVNKIEFEKALRIINETNKLELIIDSVDIMEDRNIIIRITDLLSCKMGEANNLDHKLKALTGIIEDLETKEIRRGVIDMSHEGYPTYSPIE